MEINSLKKAEEIENFIEGIADKCVGDFNLTCLLFKKIHSLLLWHSEKMQHAVNDAKFAVTYLNGYIDLLDNKKYDAEFMANEKFVVQRLAKSVLENELLDSWNTRAEPEPRALTVEELRGMEIAPLKHWVWIKNLKYPGNLDICATISTSQTGESFNCGWPGVGYSFEYADYGKTWLAYDRPPKGE